MSEETEAQREKRLAYARGYQSGWRKGQKELSGTQSRREEREFWDAAFIACMNGTLVNGKWGCEVDGKHVNWTTAEEYAIGSAQFATEMLKQRRKNRP